MLTYTWFTGDLNEWGTVRSRIGRLRVVEMQFLQINYKLMRSLSNLSRSPIVRGDVKGLKQPKQLCPAELKPRGGAGQGLALTVSGTILELRADLPDILV